jgi:MFS family permease
VLFTLTLSIPHENQALFLLMLAVTALFIPFAAPNVVSTVYDVTLPEVRSSALAVQYFIESSGAALAPGIAGLIADQTSLKSAFLIICVFTWILCGGFFALVAWLVPGDIRLLRGQMAERAAQEKAAAG